MREMLGEKGCMKTLKGSQKKYLRGLAHNLSPAAFVGQKGVTSSLVQEVNEGLDANELIKVKLIRSAPGDIDRVAEELTEKVPCHVAQKIGKTILLFNQRKKDPEIVLPKPTPPKKTPSSDE